MKQKSPVKKGKVVEAEEAASGLTEEVAAEDLPEEEEQRETKTVKKEKGSQLV